MEAENRDCFLSPLHIFLWIPTQEFSLCPDLPCSQFLLLIMEFNVGKDEQLKFSWGGCSFAMEWNYSAFQMDNGFSLVFFFQLIYRENSVNLIMMQRLKRKRKSASFTSRVTAPKERTAFICTISLKNTSKSNWNFNFYYFISISFVINYF